MRTEHEEHAHEHKLVEIVDTNSLTAFDQHPHQVITLRMHQRGVSLDLEYEEATALADVMSKVAEYVKGQEAS